MRVAHHKLSVLQLAEALGNVSEVGWQRGVSRTQFYEYKRRIQTHGIEGVKDLPLIPKSNPLITPPEHMERIMAINLEHPTWGCNRVCDFLALEGIKISYPTIQNILNKHGMGTRYERLLKLEEKALSHDIEFSPAQVERIKKANPCFREWYIESSYPGETLSQDSFYVEVLKVVSRVYLHAVVDTFGSYTFGFLHTRKQPEAAVAVVHNDVLPFYQEKGLKVEAIITDNSREFCRKDTHPYELYLELNNIEHRRTQARRPQSNGFVERFNPTVLDEFFRVTFRKKFYETVEALQVDLDTWLVHYNTERPHQSYRNRGRRPSDTINIFADQSIRNES